MPTGIAALPRVMVAPNGARRSKADHPALPMTIAETVATAKACFEVGADGLHAHVRDASGEHVLDAGLYRELLSEMASAVPDMLVQITTEAVGRYNPAEQRALVENVKPVAVSMALREIMAEADNAVTARFFAYCSEQRIAVQHILYDAGEVEWLDHLVSTGIVPAADLQLLFVLGRYADQQIAIPDDLDPFVAALRAASFANASRDANWGVCAFGPHETACLAHAHAAGGRLRVGFENGLWNADGTLAADNAARVRDVASAIGLI